MNFAAGLNESNGQLGPTTNAYVNSAGAERNSNVAAPGAGSYNTANNAASPGPNYGVNAGNTNNDRGGVAQNYGQNATQQQAPQRAPLAPVPAPNGPAQQQQQQDPSRGYAQNGGAAQGLTANGGIAATSEPAVVTGRGNVAQNGVIVANGAYRVLLTSRQQAELNEYLSRRGDQWAERQVQAPAILTTGASRTDGLAANRMKRELATESLDAGLKQDSDRSGPAYQGKAAATSRPADSEYSLQQEAPAAKPAEAEARVRLRNGEESELAKRSAMSKAKAADPTDVAASAPTTSPAPSSQTLAAAAAPAPTALGSLRGVEGAADKLQSQQQVRLPGSLGQAAVADEAQPVLIIFNEQPASLPTTLPANAPATHPAAEPAKSE
jgi:hypothetical protein